MRLTKKLIAQTCLPVYEKVLKEGKKDNTKRFLKRLMINNAEDGICLLYENNGIFPKKIYKFRPLKNKCNRSCKGKEMPGILLYYYKIPYFATSKKEMIECINKRVELLNSWL